MKTKRITSIMLVLIILICSFVIPHTSIFADEEDLVTTRGTGISSGEEYYIMNSSGNCPRFLAPNSSNRIDIVDVTAWLPEALNESRLKWKVIKQSDGTYKLWSFSGNGMIMRAYTDTGTIEVEYDENDDSVKFEIRRIENGDYEGKYVIQCGDYYVSRFNETYVRLTHISEFNASVCWTFMAVDMRFAGLYSTRFTGPDTTLNDNRFFQHFGEFGYEAYTEWDYHWTNNFLNSLTEDDIFIYTGRTSTATLDFYNVEGTSPYLVGGFTADYETSDSGQNQCYACDLAENSLCLSRCIIYLGNDTGTTLNGYNLVDATFDKGAHYVLGIQGSITTAQRNAWVEAFINAIAQGKTISQAVDIACGNNTSYVKYSRGDGDQYLNINTY